MFIPVSVQEFALKVFALVGGASLFALVLFVLAIVFYLITNTLGK